MTEMQAVIGREQLKSLDEQIKKRNLIANLYLDGLKDYYLKYDILKKPDFKYQPYTLKQNLKKCNQYIHAFYRLNFIINKNKIKQNKLIQQLNKNKIDCGVGACPEIYREKIFKKLKIFKNKRLNNAKFLGKTSITFPINPNRKLVKVREEISIIKNLLKKYI